MKPAPFDYERPTTLAAALEVMAAEQVTALAGGQSLMPLLARRQVRPRTVCDLNRVPELVGIEVTDDTVTIGAGTRQRDIELHAGLAAALPVLGRAVSTIGFLPVRHRGTIGGSLSHADPCAELPTAALLLGATVLVQHASGQREVSAADFVLGDFGTCLVPGELVTAVRFDLPQRQPQPQSQLRYGAVKLRSGADRPVGCLAAITSQDGVIVEARVAAYGGGGPSGRLAGCEERLLGLSAGDRAGVAEAAARGAAALSPLAGAQHDHGSRRELAAVAIERAVLQTLGGGEKDD